MIVTGVAIAPGSAEKTEMQIELGEDGYISCRVRGEQFRFNAYQIQLHRSPGSLPLILEFNNGWTFTPTENQQLDTWFSRFKKNGFLQNAESAIEKIEKRWRWIAATLLLTTVFGYLIYLFALPVTIQFLARQMPASVHVLLEESSWKLLNQSLFLESELPEARQKEIRENFTQLLEQVEPSLRSSPRFFFKKSAVEYEQMNAFTLANSSVIMLDDLVNILSDEELTAVMLHEIGHVKHNHIMKQLVRSFLFSVTLAVVTTDIAVIGDIINGAAITLLTLGYSRTDEEEADDYAKNKLISIYGTTEHLASALQKIENQDSPQAISPSWLQSHPDVEARIKIITGSD